jgi:DNA polymerase III sliding clamp (beta) subunit (PCNA family)
MKGKTLYEKNRFLAPIARKGKRPELRRLRVRCPDPDTVEFAIAGDLLTIRTFAHIDGEGFDDDAWVDGDVLYKMSQKLKKRDVHFELLRDSHDLELTAGNVATTFPASDGRQPAESMPTEHSFTMPAALFDDVMSEALPYASNDSAREKLCGVFIDCPDRDDPNVTATDGHRLFNRRFPSSEWEVELPDDGILLPDQAVKYALKLVDAGVDSPPVTISFDDENLVIEQLTVFRIDTEVAGDGNYPDFRQCLPATNGSPVATFDGDELKAALKMSKPFLGKSESVRIVYNGSVQLQVDAGEAGQFEADLHGTYGGASPARLAFNSRYLAQACDTVGGEVRQYVGDVFDPQLLFVSSDDLDERTRVIVMPMRL